MSKAYKTQKKMMSSLNKFIKTNMNKIAGSNRIASYGTQVKRREVLSKSFKDLYQLGYRLETHQSFSEKHLEALGHMWEKEGLSPKTITDRISIFRVFAHEIGKPGLIKDKQNYVKDPQSVKRSYVTKVDKTWTGQGVDIVNKIEQAFQKDQRVGGQLLLQAAFGLRMKESSLLNPHKADGGNMLYVTKGTKGGRDREIPIKNEFQRAVLDHVKSMVAKNKSMVPEKYNFKEWRNHYYWTVRSCGITRQDGIVSHGLRHERLNEVYKEEYGGESPVKGGKITDKEKDSFARQMVSHIAGHGREDVAAAYVGGKR